MPNFAHVLNTAEAMARRLTLRERVETDARDLEQVRRLKEEQQQGIGGSQSYYNSLANPVMLGSVADYQHFLHNNPAYAYNHPPARGSWRTSGEAAVAPVAVVVDEPSREMLVRVPIDAETLTLEDPRQKLAAKAEALLGYTPLRKELRTPGTLRRVLARLEIEVLDQESVNRYKAQMVEHLATTKKMQMPTWRLTKLREYTQPVPEFVLQKAVEIKQELPEAEFYIDQLAVDPFLIVSLTPITDYHVNRPTRNLDPEAAAYVEVWAEPKFEEQLLASSR